MWAITPEDWYIGEFLLDRDKVMEERFGWLEELSHEIRQQFMQPISIHKEDMTLGDLEYLMEHGDKDAIEYWEKELQPEIIELCDALVVLINKTFDNDPAKPFFELLKSMSLSKNPLHRAIVKPYSDWTLNRVREQGAKLLTDELSKSSNQLPEQDISQSKHETNVGSISVGNNVEGSMIIKGDGNTVVMNAPVSKKRKS
jgi:hypothetical protein